MPLPISNTELFSGKIVFNISSIGLAFRSAEAEVRSKKCSDGGDFCFILVHLSSRLDFLKRTFRSCEKDLVMLQKLKEALLGLKKEPGEVLLKSEPVKLACAALLARAAWLDGRLDQKEEDALLSLITQRFSLDVDEAQNLIIEATADVDNSNDIYRYTKVLRDAFNEAERIDLMEMLWQLVYSDGELHDFEATLMRRLAGLLYVDDRDSGLARKRALEKLGIAG